MHIICFFSFISSVTGFFVNQGDQAQIETKWYLKNSRRLVWMILDKYNKKIFLKFSKFFRLFLKFQNPKISKIAWNCWCHKIAPSDKIEIYDGTTWSLKSVIPEALMGISSCSITPNSSMILGGMGSDTCPRDTVCFKRVKESNPHLRHTDQKYYGEILFRSSNIPKVNHI